MASFKSLDINGPAFGFNEAGMVLFLVRAYKRIQRINPTLDTPEKVIAALKAGSTQAGPAVFTQAQINRLFHLMLACMFSWRPLGGIGNEVGEGVDTEVTDDGGAA